MARLLAIQGASVVVNDLGPAVDGSGQDSGPAHDVVAGIGEAGGKAMASGADIADFTAAEKLVESAIEEFGLIDILVNVAGILRDRMIFNMTEQEWDDVIRVHLKGTFNTTKFASAHWRSLRDESAQNRIINFTSVSGLHGAAPRPRSARRCGASPPRWRPVRWIGLDVVLIATPTVPGDCLPMGDPGPRGWARSPGSAARRAQPGRQRHGSPAGPPKAASAT